jgi:hypothetical protein
MLDQPSQRLGFAKGAPVRRAPQMKVADGVQRVELSQHERLPEVAWL